MPKLDSNLKGASCITKHPKPILTKDDIPYDAECIYNAGVAKINGKYVMIFRDDYVRNEENFYTAKVQICIGVAISDNGIDNWKVIDKPIIDSKDFNDGEVLLLYDPRITVIKDKIYLCMAMDTLHGIRGCIASLSDDLTTIEIISITAPDNRNMVLFPEKINGKYIRLERPFPVYGRGGLDRFDIWLSTSPDLKFWGETELVLGVEHVPFANDKIGPAAPPIKTEKGWLTTFHAVDIDTTRGKNGWEHKWQKRYTAGIMLLDLENPSKVIGISKEPLLVPELYHETEVGLRQNVIFPGSMILEPDGEVKIYYGASDTVECVATAKLDDLLALCTEEK